MSPETPAGWTLRLVDLLGAALDAVTEKHLENLVTGGVREDADLDSSRSDTATPISTGGSWPVTSPRWAIAGVAC